MNMDALIGWYQAQTPRDQKVAAIGAVLLVLAVILAIFVPLDTSVSRAHTRVQHKQSDLAWMQSVAPQLAAAGNAIAAPTSQRSLIAVIDTSARESGLGAALNSSEPNGPGALRIRLDKASSGARLGRRFRRKPPWPIAISTRRTRPAPDPAARGPGWTTTCA